jgi:hypothetical protein
MTYNIESDGTVTLHHNVRGTSMNFGRVSISDIIEGYQRWVDGDMIQYALSFLNADQREFIMTGITPEMWNEMFGDSCHD